MSQDEVTAEYASIRKVKKLERSRREEVVEDGEREHQSVSSSESSSSTLPRKTVEPFQLPNFPKVNMTQISHTGSTHNSSCRGKNR